MLYQRIEQLHIDIAVIVGSPGLGDKAVPSSTLALFSELLDKVNELSGDTFAQSFPNSGAETTYYDLLVMIGQLAVLTKPTGREFESRSIVFDNCTFGEGNSVVGSNFTGGSV